MKNRKDHVLLILLFCVQLVALASSQAPANSTNTPNGKNTTTPALDPTIQNSLDRCSGVFLTYQALGNPVKIHPFSTPGSQQPQPFSFQSRVTLTNNGYEPVKQWEVSIGFQHDEVIAQADGVLFLNGLAPPGLRVGNDTRILGTTDPDLLTSIDTAGNPNLISSSFTILGTEFGVNETGFPLPANLSLVRDGYECGNASFSGNSTVASNEMWVCCVENITLLNNTLSGGDSGFPLRQKGDVTLTYDIVNAFDGSYLAQVSLSMDNPLGRIDYWNLTWQWQHGEFINTMRGAQVFGSAEQDKCVLGPAAQQWKSGVDFGSVMSCSPNPVIVDLSQDLKNDPNLGNLPGCCRNGTLYTVLMDPAQTKSVFQLNVFKLDPYRPQQELSPPLNWNIAAGYECTQPVQVSPTQFNPESLHSSSAVASWQVVCNLKVTEEKTCCVSFSTYYNDSVIPCPKCACGGCVDRKLPWNGEACNPFIDAMFLPYNGVLVTPSNRTALAIQLAKTDFYPIPQPLPCPDNCGVSINWHLYSDYADGWSARMTLFNWDGAPVPDWFAAVYMPAAMPGFQGVYSFNGSKVPGMNNTLFIEGQHGYNDYLLQKDPSDNPGKVQSVLSFDKTRTPNIQVTKGDGFPERVWFNGQECKLPAEFPMGSGSPRRIIMLGLQLILILITTFFLST